MLDLRHPDRERYPAAYWKYGMAEDKDLKMAVIDRRGDTIDADEFAEEEVKIETQKEKVRLNLIESLCSAAKEEEQNI